MKPVDLAVGAFVCISIGAGIGVLMFARLAPESTTVALIPTEAPVVIATATAPPSAQPLPIPQVAPLPTATAVQPIRSGKAQVNLGSRPYIYGSQAQANDLLTLMAQQPGKNEYSIAYDTGDDAVVFGCDLNAGVLARIHLNRDGHGTNESWHGYVLERIRGAAAGSSLNDTPAGKSLVKFESF